MRKHLLLGAVALGLSGCATGAGVPSTGQITEGAKQIQQYTRLFCSFVPTAATIAAILTSGTSAPFATIAKDICDAVTNVPLADGPRRQPKAYGVVIKGSFVR